MFKYDVLIEENDICNYEEEIKKLSLYIKNNEKVVLYAPRRYGKTSILINVLGKRFLKENKKALFCYVNLQEVNDLHSISVRLSHSIEDAVRKAFPARSLLSKATELLSSLRPKIEIDPLTGNPSLSLTLDPDRKRGLNDIFRTMKEISEKYRLFLVMDEFQDVAFVPEAEALIRGFLQTMNKSPIVISGSKRHILKDIFLDEKRPFYNWGKSVELKPIPFKNWRPYILQRFTEKKITMEDNVIEYILESMFHIPNYVCKLCSDIYDTHSRTEVSLSDTKDAIHHIYLSNQSRYAEKVSFLTNKQIKLLTVIAGKGRIKEITAQQIVSESGISTRGISTIYKALLNKGYLEKDANGIRIADPIFAYYLTREF